MSIGYISGLRYVYITSGTDSVGIQENYNGNEEDLDATTMKFKKTEMEVLSVVHSHIISYSLIFGALGIILCFSSLPKKLRAFLIVEPFISIVLTFGGIWLIWKEVHWMSYVVMFSGMVLSISFFSAVAFLFYDLFRRA